MVRIQSDQRKKKRFKYEATVWHDNLFPQIFYETKMRDISQGGIYFESDQTLYAGERIYVAIKDPSGSDNDYKDYENATTMEDALRYYDDAESNDEQSFLYTWIAAGIWICSMLDAYIVENKSYHRQKAGYFLDCNIEEAKVKGGYKWTF